MRVKLNSKSTRSEQKKRFDSKIGSKRTMNHTNLHNVNVCHLLCCTAVLWGDGSNIQDMMHTFCILIFREKKIFFSLYYETDDFLLLRKHSFLFKAQSVTHSNMIHKFLSITMFCNFLLEQTNPTDKQNRSNDDKKQLNQ